MENINYTKQMKIRRFIENQICQWYRKNVDKHSRLLIPKNRAYDIIVPVVGHVEVYFDRLAAVTGKYAFIMEDKEGNPTGFAQTIAKESVIVDDDFVIRMATTSLLYLINDNKNKKIIPMGGTDSEGKRGWGYIIDADPIRMSPYGETLKRWF